MLFWTRAVLWASGIFAEEAHEVLTELAGRADDRNLQTALSLPSGCSQLCFLFDERCLTDILD